jgi:Concanavalin A-like lectin/glucanases superfamily
VKNFPEFHTNKINQRFQVLWGFITKNSIGLFSKRDALIIALFTLLGVGGVFAASLITVSTPEAQGAGYIAATTCDSSMSVNKNVVFDAATKRYLVTTISLSDVDQRFDENGINGCGNKVLEMALKINGSITYTSWSIPVDSGSNTFTYGGSTSSTYQSYQAKSILSPFDATSLDRIAIRVLEDNLLSGSMVFQTSDYIIRYPANDTFKLGTGDFTIDLWAWVDSGRSNGTFYDAGANVNEASGFAFWFESGALKLRRNGLVAELSTPFLSSWTNSWHHYAAVRRGTTWTMYVDGVAITNLSGNSVYAGGGADNDPTTGVNDPYNIDRNTPSVGSLAYPGYSRSYSFVGKIRNLRVIKGTALWNSNFAPPSAPLSNQSGTILLLLSQNATNATYDSSNYHWSPSAAESGFFLPTYLAP